MDLRSRPRPESDIVLRDGSTVHVTPLRPVDEEALVSFFQELSGPSVINRFFSAGINVDAFVRKELAAAPGGHLALVARTGQQGSIIAHACYHVDAEGWADIAFAVSDRYQGRGLGTILLGQLAESAEARGIEWFRAEVRPDNYRMVDVFRESGFSPEIEPHPGMLLVRFPTSITPEARERFAQRDRIAAVNAIQAVLSPRSVAVIGASRDRHKVGGQTLRNLLDYEFQGPVYPVNPGAPVVQSVLAYKTVEEIPGPLDLAIVAVPAVLVDEAVEQCGRKGVRALVVLSAGFGESGPEGQERQQRLLAACRAYGMRLIGPNCLGVANTDPRVRLNAMFSPVIPPEGGVAFASQSGALALAAMDYARARSLGISSFVSLGNKADISSNDLLCYWEEDPRTRVILLYLESFGNPQKFTQIARRVGRNKPIVIVKGGRSRAGTRGAASHTGALATASDAAVDALFQEAGVIRTETLQELFDVAALLVHQPVPRGRRVAIVSNAGGPGILCADACEAEGLEAPELAPETQAGLRAFLPPEAGVVNPVDLISTATPEQYRKALALIARDEAVDALIPIFIPPLNVASADVARALTEAAAEVAGKKPIAAVFMTSDALPELATPAVQLPNYPFPEEAARAVAHAVRHGQWRSRPETPFVRPSGITTDRAAAAVSHALGRGEGWLAPDEVEAVLRAYGLPVADQQIVPTPEDAALAAGRMAGPVALKALSPGLLHKGDAGAISLALEGAAPVLQAAEEMKARLEAMGHPLEGFLVQRMAPGGGQEMMVGISRDPKFGPLIACGAGGTAVELLGDVVFHLAPLDMEDLHGLVRGLRTYPLLTGYRGRPPLDVPALEDVLARVSALAEDFPQVVELDCNPVIVLERGALVVDARIKVAPPPARLPLGAR